MNYYYKADSLYSHMAWWSIKLSNQSWAAMSHLHNFPRLLLPVKLSFYPTLYLMIPATTLFSFSDNLRSCLGSSQFPEAWAHTEMKPVTKGTEYSTGSCDRCFCSFKNRSVSTERDFSESLTYTDTAGIWLPYPLISDDGGSSWKTYLPVNLPQSGSSQKSPLLVPGYMKL